MAATLRPGGLAQISIGESAPDAWLRLLAAGGTVAAGLVVVSGALDLGFTHNALAATALAPLLALETSALLAHRRLLRVASAALFLMLLEIALGGLVALSGDARWAAGLHLATAALACAAAAVATVSTFRGAPAAVPARADWRDYLTLTKPRVMTLLLLTGACGMFVGAQGAPPAGKLVAMLLGLSLACGGAGAMNHVLDRDIDRLMGERTARRPVAGGRIPAAFALDFGLALCAASFVLLAGLVNVASAALALGGAAFYVVVYTGWLKRTTWHNTVAGGVAGAFPPLVGYAAATGRLDVTAFLLFLIVFVWQPPHFWALALLIKEHYAAANVPMLPVLRGERRTIAHIVWWSVALLPVSALPFLTGALGPLYLASALALGSVFLALALRLRRDPKPRPAMVLFHYSLAYLALLFVAAAVDAALL